MHSKRYHNYSSSSEYKFQHGRVNVCLDYCTNLKLEINYITNVYMASVMAIFDEGKCQTIFQLNDAFSVDCTRSAERRKM